MIKNVALATALCTGAGMATAGPEFSFSGYGTVGVAVTDNDEAQYRNQVNQDKGADKSPSLTPDTRLGLQGTVKFNEIFSAVGQVLASRYEAKNTAHVEWLYAQVEPTSWLDVRAGRMVLPVFLISDSRNVGYAAHWLRAPGEVYATFPLSYFDGLQAQARANWWDTNFSLQASGGKAKGNIYADPGFKFKQEMEDIRSFNLTVERGDFTLRYGRSSGTQAVIGFGVPPVREAFSGVGAQYDNGRLLVMGEFVTRRQADGGADNDGKYISAGWRMGPWMPYATVSRSKLKGPIYRFQGLPDGKTEALGIRWDAMKNTAVKAQVDRTSDSSRVIGAPLGYTFPRTMVYSLAVDFVF